METAMKRQALLVLGLACLGIGFDATAGEREMMKQVADEAGVSIDDVRMVLGSRSQHAQYRTSYDRVAAKVKTAMRLIAQREEAKHRVIVRVEPKPDEIATSR
jgi:hypothetical protein